MYSILIDKFQTVHFGLLKEETELTD